MKKLLREGKDKIFIKTCNGCLSDFTYQICDAYDGHYAWYVECPACGYECSADFEEVKENPKERNPAFAEMGEQYPDFPEMQKV